MLEFLIDNILVSFGGALFLQVVGIPMGTNCAPLLADLFLFSTAGVKKTDERQIKGVDPTVFH
jgi:hypothetical protein